MTTLETAATAEVSSTALPDALRRAGAPLSETTRLLLDLMQDEFPLVPRPYEALGKRLGLTEAQTLEYLAEARAAGVVRQICAIFDTKALGYSSALVAMRIAPEQLRRAVAVVNAHPGVSHNYRRSHDFNLWFTVAMPPGDDLDEVIQKLHVLTGAESTRPMPTLHLFKIAVTLDMTGTRDLEARGEPEYTQERRHEAARHVVSDEDIAYIRATQGDLQDILEPFAPIARELGWSVERVLEHGRTMIERGHLRRFAGIINHRTAGFRANGMAVWNVPAERIQDFGQFVAGYRGVSHCYQRPTYPDWPYSVFSMLHHPKVAGVEESAAAISRETGIEDYRVLYSTTEYKKIRLPYFIPEYDNWEALCAAAALEPVVAEQPEEVLA
ncbi:MAG: Lrp/AsnC family transcriptional regulator [Dehalococcoidia bacterium]|nr:Lrp/AsnC family transcriptional regulator [Dehalococcoidia bacterium]